MSEETDFQIDDVLSIVGGFGPFQWLCIFAFSIMVIPVTFQVLILQFITLEPSWKCKTNSSICVLNGTHDKSNKFRCSIPRREWEYTEPTEFSIVTQFDISCNRKWLLDVAIGIFFLGAACGGIGFGMLADKKGRKFSFFIALALQIIIGFAGVLSPNIYVFIVFRFLAGSFFTGCLAMIVIMVAELVESNRRPLAVNVVWVFYSLALCLLSLQAYFITTWKLLLIVCTVPYFVFLLFHLVVPESIRWLLLQDEWTKIETTFSRIAKWNKRTYTPVTVKSGGSQKTKKVTSRYLELFKPVDVAFKTVIQAYNWFASSLVYYGLSLASDQLGGSMHLNFALVSLIECPGHIASAYLSNRIGRKKSAIIPMFLASGVCISIPFIPVTGSIKIARVICGMMGKFFVTICYDTLYVWSAEIFPTQNRAKGIGLLQLFEMMGAACSPFIAKELEEVNKIAPFVVFGSLAIIGSGLMAFLPETKGKSMDS